MSTHITPPPRADQTGLEAAEPARRAARFDERGIALQTIIIIVVLMPSPARSPLVLFNRASDETERLEQTETIYDRIDSEEACKIAGGSWSAPTCTAPS